MTGGYYADGAIDPTAPYCKHLPTNAAGKTIDKPGTVAIPKAAVYLVATDTTGGQNGPFLLGYAKSAPKCPTVPNVVPAVEAHEVQEVQERHEVKARNRMNSPVQCQRRRATRKSNTQGEATLKPKTIRAVGVAAAMWLTLGVPAAAGAVTLTGSGSSAAQPYMLELFKGYSKLHHSIKFKYIADGGNAGVKDVQAGRSEFAINTRPPLPSRRRHDVREAVPGRTLHRGQHEQLAQQHLAARPEERLPRRRHELGPGRRLEPVDDDRPDRP